MNEDIKKRIISLSDEVLIEMVEIKKNDYTIEALEIAYNEINKRGGLDFIKTRLYETLLREQEEEKELKDKEYTDFFNAIASGDFLTIQNLVSKGININYKGNNNVTGLMIASAYNHLDILSFLLSKGADVNSKSIDGKTPLMVAAERGNINIIALLIENGGDIKIKDKEGKTVLDYAKNKETTDLLTDPRSPILIKT